jgi:hypothetical protein
VVTVDEATNTSRAEFLRFVVLGAVENGRGGAAEWGLPPYQAPRLPVFPSQGSPQQEIPTAAPAYRVEAHSAPFWLDAFGKGPNAKQPAIPLDVKLLDAGPGVPLQTQGRPNAELKLEVSLEYTSAPNPAVVDELGTATRILRRGRFSGRIDIPIPPWPLALPAASTGYLVFRISVVLEVDAGGAVPPLSTVLRIPLVRAAERCFPLDSSRYEEAPRIVAN